MAQTSTQKEKKFDYILVAKEYNLPLIKEYIDNLKKLGFEIETEAGKTVDLTFLKVFISEEALRHFSEVYDIGNQDVREVTILYIEPIIPNPFRTPIARVLPKVKGEITDAEKIMIINQVLENTKFGENEKDFGVSKLIRLGILETAYPLHDGPITDDFTNVRSVLFYYWSNTAVTHNPQPLDLIYRYFGTEIAFYFTWLEYFNFMLIIPAILGGLTFIGSAAYVFFGDSKQVKEICQNRNSFMCPTCEGNKNCRFKPISQYCALAHWSVIFDNQTTICFAIFMSFWAILFLNLWRRKENKLKMRWHTDIEDLETDIRQAYVDGATHRRRNVITGEMEPYTPKYILTCKYTLTSLVCAFLIGIIFVAVMLIVTLKILIKRWLNLSHKKYLGSNASIITMCVGSILQVICIKIFSKLYGPLSVKLTKFENPRTQHDFDNSVLYKRYLLSFVNNYVPLFYLAFFKGALYTVPHKNNFFSNDVCQPLNCIVGLCVQLAFLLALKDLAGNFVGLIFLTIKNEIIKVIKHFTKSPVERGKEEISHEIEIPQWEQEYFLFPTDRYLLTKEFTEMIIKYGFITFFVAAFPLAPLCALANNLIELRSDAYKLVKLFRRPVPLSKSGIGAWNGVILAVTYISTCTNAFVIAFTSDWVPREVYRLHQGQVDISGYINTTLSRYETNEYEAYKSLNSVPPYCFYRSHQYLAERGTHKYHFNEAYWMNLTFRFIAVFCFEHIILLCNAVLSYSINKFPGSVKEQLNLDQHQRRTARFADFERTLEKSGKLNKDKIRSILHLQWTREKALEPSIILLKDGSISSAHCTCIARLSERPSSCIETNNIAIRTYQGKY